MCKTPPDALNALDRMDEIATCWAAVRDLMTPDGDLQRADRDNLAVLLGFLDREYHAARQELAQTRHGGGHQ